MNKSFFILALLLSFISCENVNNKSESNDENKISPDQKEEKGINDSLIFNKTDSVIGLPDVPKIQENKKSLKSNSKIGVNVFRNEGVEGFGYDIIIDGHKYIHQPNIPALPGNNGFTTEQHARKVADLVCFKIRNNIMPPTVDIKELDSLGVK
jgi:hypothetical protein